MRPQPPHLHRATHRPATHARAHHPPPPRRCPPGLTMNPRLSSSTCGPVPKATRRPLTGERMLCRCCPYLEASSSPTTYRLHTHTHIHTYTELLSREMRAPFVNEVEPLFSFVEVQYRLWEASDKRAMFAQQLLQTRAALAQLRSARLEQLEQEQQELVARWTKREEELTANLQEMRNRLAGAVLQLLDPLPPPPPPPPPPAPAPVPASPTPPQHRGVAHWMLRRVGQPAFVPAPPRPALARPLHPPAVRNRVIILKTTKETIPHASLNLSLLHTPPHTPHPIRTASWRSTSARTTDGIAMR